MTTGDVAMFEITKPHNGLRKYSIGTTGSVNPDVAIIAYGAIRADGSVTKIFLPKVKLAGLPLNFTEKAFGEYEVTGIAMRATDPFNTAQEIVADVSYIQG
jgi:hypothetical protein